MKASSASIDRPIKVSLLGCDSDYGQYLVDILSDEELVWLYGNYDSGMSFLKDLDSPFKPDVCLIHSPLNDLSDMECAKLIKSKCNNMHIIFISKEPTLLSLAEARNLCIDFIERGTRMEELISHLVVNTSQKKEQIISLNCENDEIIDFLQLANQLKIINSRINTLSENQMKVLKLKRSGKSINEISSTLDMSFETTRTHLRRGVNKLDIPNIWDYIHV